MTIPLSSTNSNLTPDYSKETTQVQAKKAASQGASSAGKGVILTKDSLEVPFVEQTSVHANEAEAGRPSLPPLFRARFVDDRQVEDLSRDYYQALRESLPALLKEKLENDEEKLFEDRDPNLVALDTSLKFEANLLALADTILIPNADNEKVLLGAQQYLALPEIVQKELLTYGSTVTRFLDHYLSTIGRNDPSYEILVNVSNQIKEALELLSLNCGTSSA